MNKKYITLALVAILFSACGSSSSTKTIHDDGKGEIDLKNYYPSDAIDSKIFSSESSLSTLPSEYQEITVTKDTITTKIKGKITEKVVFSDTNITTKDFEDNKTDTTYRHVDIGDTLYSKKINSENNNSYGKIITKTEVTCKLKSKEKEYKNGIHSYSGDLLKIECIVAGEMIYDIKKDILNDIPSTRDLNGSHEYYDTSFYYLQKGKGEIADIDDNCLVSKNLPFIDDRKKDKDCAEKNYEYKFYLP